MPHGNRKHFGCKIEGCLANHHCKGFCKSHYGAYYKGFRDMDGNPIGDYKPLPKVCKFPGCDTKGTAKSSLRNGLCNRHRKWAEKGLIDRETCDILQPDKIPQEKKPKMSAVTVDGKTHVFKNKCRISKCLKEARRNGLCEGHSSSFKANKIDINGNPLYDKMYYDYTKDRCKIKECSQDSRLIRGFCKHHYQKYMRGQIDFEGNPAPEGRKLEPKYTYSVHGSKVDGRERGQRSSQLVERELGESDTI